MSGSWNIHKDSVSEIWKDFKETIDEYLKDRGENVAVDYRKRSICYTYGGNFDGAVTCDNVEKREYQISLWIWSERNVEK